MMSSIDPSYQAIVRFLEQAVAEAGVDEGHLRAELQGDTLILSAYVKKADGKHSVTLVPVHAQLVKAVASIYHTMRKGHTWNAVDFTLQSGQWTMRIIR